MTIDSIHPTILKTVRLQSSSMHLRSDGIIELICDDDFIFEIPAIKEIVKAAGELTGGKKSRLLTITGKQTSISKEAREFAATHEAVKYSLAEAYVIHSVTQKILGNFFIKFNMPKVPTRMFNDKAKAEKWLLGLMFND